MYSRDVNELQGFAGYWHFRTPPSLERLFGAASDHWNRGIATEASQCIIRYGFEDLGFREIEACTDGANVVSVRLLRKLRMSLSKRRLVNGLDTVFYILDAEAWRNASQRSEAVR